MLSVLATESSLMAQKSSVVVVPCLDQSLSWKSCSCSCLCVQGCLCVAPVSASAFTVSVDCTDVLGTSVADVEAMRSFWILLRIALLLCKRDEQEVCSDRCGNLDCTTAHFAAPVTFSASDVLQSSINCSNAAILSTSPLFHLNQTRT